MTEVKWIKLLTGMFDDEKIKLIENIPEADMILIIWIKLLTLAGKKNVNGYIFLTENIPYTDEMLATIFNRPLNTIRLALETFKKFGMISFDENEIMYITNWEKHQNIEGLEKIREQNRLRQRKFQEEHKKLPKPKKGNNVSITLNNATDKKRLDKKRLDKKRLDKKRLEEEIKDKDIVFKNTLTDFKEMRIEKKKSMTDKAVDLLLKKLYKLSDDEDEQIEILNQSIINGWTGIYPLKNNYTKPTKEDDDDYDNTFVDLREEMGI